MILMLIKYYYLKKNDNEYIIRYNNVNKIMVVPLQLKINDCCNETNALKKNNKVMYIYNDDKEFFRKCIEIWDNWINRYKQLHFLKADDDDK